MDSDGQLDEIEDRKKVAEDEGNIYSSQLAMDNNKHCPSLDIDFMCELIPSSTDGHFHLYIDAPMSWDEYQELLHVLAKVGILQEGYVGASIKRGATFLRKPGVYKEEDEHLIPFVKS